jgi:DNA polymerase V
MPVLSVSSDQPIQISPNPLRLDICGWSVPAGFTSPAADHTHKRIDLNEHLIRNGDATHVFRVRGDSMTGIGIYEGDKLLVDRSIEPKHNHIVLAVLNNEFTLVSGLLSFMHAAYKPFIKRATKHLKQTVQ